jgi:hypothetical protein
MMKQSPARLARLKTAAALVGTALLYLGLQGCATPNATSPDASKPATPGAIAKPGAGTSAERAAAAAAAAAAAGPTPAEVAREALAGGVESYNKGEFNAAIRKLTVPELGSADVTTQIAALKYSAFSYCVTKRVTLCRQQFEKAFRLEPHFALSSGEKGHPLWTPAFNAAKKATAAAGKSGSNPKSKSGTKSGTSAVTKPSSTSKTSPAN